MVKISSKKGFSLFEAALVMLIAAVFIVVMASVFPHKPKPKAQAEAHGRFECYYVGNSLKYRTVVQGNVGSEQTSNASDALGKYCEFVPSRFARYLIIDAVGGGSGGAGSGSVQSMGGSAGVFSSSFFATPMTSYRLYPGKGGAVDHNTDASAGGTTYVVGYKDATHSETLMEVLGGSFLGSLATSNVDDIDSCRITKTTSLEYYNCGSYPKCELINDKIEISYCRRQDVYRTVPYDFHIRPGDSEDKKLDTIGDNKCTTRTSELNKWVYRDISVWRDWKKSPVFNYGNPNPCPTDANLNDMDKPSLFTMELLMKVPDTITNAGEDSDMYTFVKAMHYGGNIVTVKPGNGGALNSAGSAGAVVVMW